MSKFITYNYSISKLLYNSILESLQHTNKRATRYDVMQYINGNFGLNRRVTSLTIA
jgi:hypothetical protein